MTPRMKHLQRYKDIVALLWKYGRSDLMSKVAVEEALDEPVPEPAEGDRAPAQLADDLEALGPTFVKLGQILSSRPDLVKRQRLAPSKVQFKLTISRIRRLMAYERRALHFLRGLAIGRQFRDDSWRRPAASDGANARGPFQNCHSSLDLFQNSICFWASS